ncbi:MAG TPA: AtpZ/AtpI family protein [Pyrinomonadaceae bacterium]|nr:AtpZ/AtpI family protein [Pyrinomonadaceae bacterium]
MIKNFLDSDESPEEPTKSSDPAVISLFDDKEKPPEEPFSLSEAKPQSLSENVRQSGLAYSAGIALFASVVFMLLIGWGADLLFGSSPWGIVSGIVLGALIGFFQFFRLTSQIFKK